MKTLAQGLALAAALMLAVVPGASARAQSLPPISTNQHVMERLLAASIGDAIRRNCPSITDRTFVVRTEALKLYNHARSLGYDHEAIDGFLRDRAERRAVHRQRDAYLEANGVVPGDAESYCRVGRAEIESNSLTGRLLRVR
jgi:hypothetical protein